MATVAFIGVGNMGGPMSANLVKAGHKVMAFDLSTENLSAAVEAGCIATTSVAEAVSDADAVFTMLPAGKHVEAVYRGEAGVMANARPGALYVDCSTIDVETARAVIASAEEKGFRMVDCPVSGGVTGAAAGTLAMMCGGSDDAFKAARPYLEILGKTVVHAGGPGAGQAAKTCNNMILGISMIGVCEAFMLAEKLDLDLDKLFSIAANASGQCWALTSYCPVPGPVPASPANRDYKPGFTAANMLKDLKLAQQAAQSSGASTPLGSNAATLYDQFVEAGNGEVDFSGIIRMIAGQGKSG
ncbi:MAG: 3-hydroxyisobutyrate dehydrogenase [Rhodospirillales bacterium]